MNYPDYGYERPRRNPPRTSPERIDQGDLDAAMARVTIEGTFLGTVAVACLCRKRLLEGTDNTVNMLELVHTIAEHLPVCPEVGRMCRNGHWLQAGESWCRRCPQ